MSVSMNYAALLPSTGDAASPTASLLDTLYGHAPGKKLGAANPLQALQTAEANETKDVARIAKQPAVAREIAAFKTALATAKDAATLLKNPTVMKVLLTANGLADRIAYPALTQKMLLSDATDPKSLVSKLSATDSRWKPVVQTYDFAHMGLTVLRQSGVLDSVLNAYAEVTWRNSLDATTPGLSNALDFRARATTVKNADQVLGDPVLRDVITTALGIPKQIAFQPLTAQEHAINIRLDFAKLKDKHFVDTLTQQYLLNKANAATTETTQPTLDQLSAKAAGLIV